jgi:hypothetical protein
MRLWRRFWQWLLDALGVADILCDTCRYDHATACRRPQRPNARRCLDYRRR